MPPLPRNKRRLVKLPRPRRMCLTVFKRGFPVTPDSNGANGIASFAVVTPTRLPIVVGKAQRTFSIGPRQLLLIFRFYIDVGRIVGLVLEAPTEQQRANHSAAVWRREGARECLFLSSSRKLPEQY